MDSKLSEELEECWSFRFSLESQSGAPVSRATAEKYFAAATSTAEGMGLQVGGGFRSGSPSPYDEWEGKLIDSLIRIIDERLEKIERRL